MIFAHPEVQTVLTPRPPVTLEGCALEETRVTAAVSGFIAEVRVEQRYQNTHDTNLNTRYTFPLPHDAAVCAFEFTVAGKVIHGEVREKGAARAAFDSAREAGQRAGLVDQQRPNVFTIELANIPAHAKVTAVVTYLEALPYRSGEFELRFPTVVAPRYEPKGTAPLPAKHEVSPGHTMSVDLRVDAGMTIESWHCKTHALEVQPSTGNELRFKLTRDRTDRDLVFGYRVGGAGIRLGLVTHRPDPAHDGTFYLFAVPPTDVGSADVRGKELIFLLDRSGSMGGPKMHQAREALKACLRALNPADAFAIYAFDDQSEAFAPAPVPFAQAQLEAAERWLGTIDARGGTEILPPLTQALALPAEANRQRVVVLITDGQVSNEDQLLAHIRQHVGAARVFTVGVDTAVNTHLLAKMAQLGKGAAQFVLPTGDIEGAIAGLSQRFGSPLLTDPVADFGTVRVSEVTPHPLPDVMAGQVIAIAGRFRGQGPTEVTFTGQGPGSLLEHRVEVTFPREDRTHPVVDKLWARMMIDRHEDTLLDDPNSTTIKQKIAALAIRHGLLSSQTSFLAIDERDADPQKAREAISHVVPQAMPADWDTATGVLASLAAPCPAPYAQVDCLEGSFADIDLCIAKDEDDYGGKSFFRLQQDPPAWEATDPLRELAKQQRADGSWNGSVDDTAEALLQLIEAGHTDRTGAYTAQVRRAIEWIDRMLNDGYGGPTDLLLAAITALAAATGSLQHQALEARLHA